MPLTYRVPAGWDNEEDINGRYLLLPKGSERAGGDEIKGDFVGIYTPVALAAADCSEGGQAGAGTTPAAIAAALAKRPGLTATTPQPVTFGTAKGMTVDLRLAAGWTKSCPDGDPPFPIVPVISAGYRPEILTHVVTTGLVMRLYLLRAPGGPVVVELDDTTGGKHLAQLDAVARSVRFV